MRTKTERPIPDHIMIAAANQVAREFACCADNWGEEHATRCRRLCGEAYKLVETDWIRKRAIQLRKSDKLEPVNGGPKRKAWRKPTGWYADYLLSEHWQAFRKKILKLWSYRCCICGGSATEVHHNTYSRIGCELITDCVPLCRTCHKRVHSVMPDGNELLNRSDGSEPDSDDSLDKPDGLF